MKTSTSPPHFGQKAHPEHVQDCFVPGPASVPRAAGKLALIIDRLAAKGGATADELVAALVGRHSVLGALSRLRARGFERRLDADGDRRTYRFEAKGWAMSELDPTDDTRPGSCRSGRLAVEAEATRASSRAEREAALVTLAATRATTRGASSPNAGACA